MSDCQCGHEYKKHKGDSYGPMGCAAKGCVCPSFQAGTLSTLEGAARYLGLHEYPESARAVRAADAELERLRAENKASVEVQHELRTRNLRYKNELLNGTTLVVELRARVAELEALAR